MNPSEEIEAPIFDPKQIRDWYKYLSEAASAFAKGIDPDFDLDLKEWLASSSRMNAFGGSEAVPLPNRIDDFARWLNSVWAQRCSRYLGALSRGLLRFGETKQDAELVALAERISRKTNIKFAIMPQVRRRGTDSHLLASLRLGQGIINHRKSNLDPILFSSLIHLRILGSKTPQEMRDSVIVRREGMLYEELGALSQQDFKELEQTLIDLVKREVSICISELEKKYTPPLVDQSTLWWGIRKLIFHEGVEFRVGSYRGLKGAAQLIIKLVFWTKDKPAYPTHLMSQEEVTSEIHCPLRTQLYVVLDSLSLLKFPWPKVVEADVSSSIKEIATWGLSQAMESWKGNSSLYLQKHVYFIGLALEVLTHYKSVFKDFNYHANEDSDDTTGVHGDGGTQIEEVGVTAEAESATKKYYVVWWHKDDDDQPKKLTELTSDFEKKMLKLKFDFVVDERASTIFIYSEEKEVKRVNFHDDIQKNNRKAFWLVLDRIDNPDGFNLRDLKTLLGDKDLTKESFYQYVSSSRKILGIDKLGQIVIPRRKPPCRPNSSNFNCCWILESPNKEDSKLLTLG